LTLGIKAVSSGAAMAVLSQSVKATKPSILTIQNKKQLSKK
jgi:hypothetical protein